MGKIYNAKTKVLTLVEDEDKKAKTNALAEGFEIGSVVHIHRNGTESTGSIWILIVMELL